MLNAGVDFGQAARRLTQLKEAAQDSSTVSGFTHTFYRYPARFSPIFVRAAIENFSAAGDTVLDPFVGGGTTMVEALALGRMGLGTDISSLATFVTSVKTTLVSADHKSALEGWLRHAQGSINMRSEGPNIDDMWDEAHYKRNLNTSTTWRLRKAIEQAAASTHSLEDPTLERFARCVVLRAAQWAIDGKRNLASVDAFRGNLRDSLSSMLDGMEELAQAVRSHGRSVGSTCITRSAAGLEQEPAAATLPPPKLVLTSPPYPGVHVLYHRWQVGGGKETPVPFWIARQLDGQGASYYTMGDRKDRQQDRYFETLGEVFRSVAAISHPDVVVVQMVSFASPERQLPRYLEVMRAAGFDEVSASDRFWRTVPNRRWHAGKRGETPGSKEVVLLHRRASH